MYDYLFYNFYARGISQDYVLDKSKSIASYKGYMINRLMKMFRYENLPETIPQEMLEYYLMVNGSCIITKVNNEFYAFIGSFGGEPDPYFRPTLYVVANPALKLNKTYNLWDTKALESDQCVFMRNDKLWMGLNPLMSRYATLMSENVITLRTADIMLRVISLLTAPDDKSHAAAIEYLKKIEKGELGVIGENRFFDGIKMQSPPSNNGSYLTQFIELQQYYKGSFYNEIGLAASFNMKREAIGESEASLNDDTLLPLIDTMFECRKQDISRLNEMFDLDIKVEFDSAWEQNIIENDVELAVLASDANSQLTDESGESELQESQENGDGEINVSQLNELQEFQENEDDENNDSQLIEESDGSELQESQENKGGENNIDIDININLEEGENNDDENTED